MIFKLSDIPTGIIYFRPIHLSGLILREEYTDTDVYCWYTSGVLIDNPENKCVKKLCTLLIPGVPKSIEMLDEIKELLPRDDLVFSLGNVRYESYVTSKDSLQELVIHYKNLHLPRFIRNMGFYYTDANLATNLKAINTILEKRG